MGNKGLSNAFVKAIGRREVFTIEGQPNEFIGIRVMGREDMVAFADSNGYVLSASVDDPRTEDMLPLVQVDILTYGRANVVNPTLKRAADALREGTTSLWFAVGDDGITSTPIAYTHDRPKAGDTHIPLEREMQLLGEDFVVMVSKMLRLFLARANDGRKPLDRRVDNAVYQAYRQQQATLRS